MRSYRGKIVAITGAAGGLGRELCRVFGAAGAYIGLIDLDQDHLDEVARELQGTEIRACAVRCDITNDLEVKEAFEKIEAELGPVYALVNNAGITHLKNFTSSNVGDIRRVMDVNFMGGVHCTAAALDSIRSQQGQVIAISSIAGFAPLVGRTAYCASKHALTGFCNTLRCELRDSGVGVLVIYPSFIATGLRDGYRRGADHIGREQTHGNELPPEKVAREIFNAAQGDQSELVIGRVGRLSRLVWKWWPSLYESMMLKRVRPED